MGRRVGEARGRVPALHLEHRPVRPTPCDQLDDVGEESSVESILARHREQPLSARRRSTRISGSVPTARPKHTLERGGTGLRGRLDELPWRKTSRG